MNNFFNVGHNVCRDPNGKHENSENICSVLRTIQRNYPEHAEKLRNPWISRTLASLCTSIQKLGLLDYKFIYTRCNLFQMLLCQRLKHHIIKVCIIKVSLDKNNFKLSIYNMVIISRVYEGINFLERGRGNMSPNSHLVRVLYIV